MDLSDTFLTNDRKIDALRSEHFQRLRDTTYVDHSGATLYSEVFVQQYLKEMKENLYCNPHSHSRAAARTANIIGSIRDMVLEYFKASLTEYDVIFTSNCTAALKLVAESFVFDKQKSKVDLNETFTDDLLFSELPKKRGSFVYLNDSHTSVVGMRNVVSGRGADFLCVTADDVQRALSTDPEETVDNKSVTKDEVNNLFVYPAQSNFSGERYSLSWIERFKLSDRQIVRNSGTWYILLDASSYLTTSQLDLGVIKPDFLTLSFYKIFGFPTGLGALIVRKESEHVLEKRYFGGGTVEVFIPDTSFHSHRKNFVERFEDGTLPYLEIIAIKYGLKMVSLIDSISSLSDHTFMLARYFYQQLSSLRHYNNVTVAIVYSTTKFTDPLTQGPIINFNLRASCGSFIGFSQVEQLAEFYSICLRTGCFCNIGACQQHLSLSSEQILKNFKAGHVCGDSTDMLDGLPTGSVRVSFGLMSTLRDADRVIEFIKSSFLESSESSAIINKTTEPVGHEALLLQQHCTLLNILIYPVKSCSGLQMSAVTVTHKGLKFDRQWMILDEKYNCVTQKRFPQMCKITPRIDETHDALILSYEGRRNLSVSLKAMIYSLEAEIICGKVCAERVRCYDCGDDAALWCQDVLGCSGLRLVRQIDDEHNDHSCLHTGLEDKPLKFSAAIPQSSSLQRETVGDKASKRNNLSLANRAQILLVTTASLDAVMEAVTQNNSAPEASMGFEDLLSRFRPNLIVKTFEPFLENSWKCITVGDITFQNEGPCFRCQMICVNQSTGQRSTEPFRTIATLPALKNQFGILLGSNCTTCTFDNVKEDNAHTSSLNCSGVSARANIINVGDIIKINGFPQ